MNRIVGALAILFVVSSSLTAGQSVTAGQTEGAYEVIANAFGFGVDIPGAPDASKNIREIAIDELNIDVREMTTGVDVEYRLYGPGAAHWGTAKFTSACTLGGSKELQAWWQQAAKGKNIRKNITVTLFKSDKSPGRSYRLIDAEPVAFTDCDRASADPVITLVVRPDRIEFRSKAAPAPSKPPYDNWVGIEIQDPARRENARDSWELVTGGARSLEDPPLVLGTIDPAGPPVDTKAHSTCTELILRGPMTSSRKFLADWINNTAEIKDWQRTLYITTPTAGAFSLAFPVRYVFPRMSVTNTTGNTMEEVAIKPIRCELK